MEKLFRTINKINFYFMAIFSFLIIVSICFWVIEKTCEDFSIIKNADAKIGVIQKITKQKSNEYLIEVFYQEGGETFVGEFNATKTTADEVSKKFDSEYRKGNKIPIFVGDGNRVIPCSQKKSILIKDLLFALLCVAIAIFFLWILLPKQSDGFVDCETYTGLNMLCSVLDLAGYASLFVGGIFLSFKKTGKLSFYVFR